MKLDKPLKLRALNVAVDDEKLTDGGGCVSSDALPMMAEVLLLTSEINDIDAFAMDAADKDVLELKGQLIEESIPETIELLNEIKVPLMP